MLSLLLGPVTCGRTTNKYNSVPGGGFRHHGGFLGGYFDFYRRSRDNPADSFSDKYEDDAEDDKDNGNKHLEIDYVDVSRPIEVYGINSQNYTDEEDNLGLSEEYTDDNDYIEEGKTNTDDEYNDDNEYDIESHKIKTVRFRLKNIYWTIKKYTILAKLTNTMDNMKP